MQKWQQQSDQMHEVVSSTQPREESEHLSNQPERERESLCLLEQEEGEADAEEEDAPVGMLRKM